ncbi:MAG: hypothetical protein LPJ91_08300 [Pseudazoarcus pumilus]|nr:hypothetical protein [Pseudazoarcus pumilus]
MSKLPRRLRTVLLSLCLGCLAPTVQAETVRIIVPFSEGGGTDTFARLVARHLGKHLRGKPQVVVDNITGMGGVTGANAFVAGKAAEPLTLLAASGHLKLRAMLGLRGLELDFTRLQPLLAAPMGHVTVVAADSGISNPTDIRRLRGRLTKGINDPIGQIESLVTLEMFDLDYRPAPGFGGRGATLTAFERGELSINTQSTPVYLARLEPLVRLRRVVPLYAIGFIDDAGRSVPDPAVPELVTAPQLYERVFGRAPDGPAWDAFRLVVPLVQQARASLWMHGDATPEQRQAVSSAVAAMVRDAAFHSDAQAQLGGYPVLYGNELQRVRRALTDMRPEVVDYLRRFLKLRYGVEFER